MISATPRLSYPTDAWGDTYNNQLPVKSERDVLIEYTAHPEADFHLEGRTIPVAEVERALKKFEKGTYGLCDVCGRNIEPARLEALPLARRLRGALRPPVRPLPP